MDVNQISPSPMEERKWYFQVESADEGGIAGPCSVPELHAYYQTGFIDGLTLLWREGMTEWVVLADCTELKYKFMETEDQLIDEKEEGSSGGDIKKRVRLEALDDKNKYTADDGILYVFDVVDKSWKNEEEYRRITDTNASTASDKNSELDEKKLKNKIKRKEYRERVKLKKEAGLWLRGKKNTSVYVTKLPEDVTFEELEQLFKKAGVIKIDPETTSAKIRIYRNSEGKPTGDGLISYLREESVTLAMKYLDGYEIRSGCNIKVEQAVFDVHSSSNEKSTKAVKIDRRKYLAAKYEQERLMSWGEDVDDGSGRRIVLFRPTFSRSEAEAHEEGDKFYEELKEEIEEEVRKFIPAEKVTPIARHPQGIVAVKFKTTGDAEAAIEHFRDRLFNGNHLVVYFFDGKTDLKAQCIPSMINYEAEKEEDGASSVLMEKRSIHQQVDDEKGGELERETKRVKLSDVELEDTEESERLDEFGRWLEEQSGDEFTINMEDTDEED